MIYGESHSEAIGVYINGLPEDVTPDTAKTAAFMARRAPGKNAWSTPRKEADEVIFERNGSMLHGYIIKHEYKAQGLRIHNQLSQAVPRGLCRQTPVRRRGFEVRRRNLLGTHDRAFVHRGFHSSSGA